MFIKQNYEHIFMFKQVRFFMRKDKIEKEKFKTMVIVKLEMLRGCCNIKTISKKQIAKSIEEFIEKIKETELI